MTGKRDIKVLTEILDLSDVKVRSHRLHTGIGMILQIEQEKSFSTCPKCGTTSHKFQKKGTGNREQGANNKHSFAPV